MRRRLRRALRWSAVAVAALAAALAVAAVVLVRRPWPQESGRVAAAGLARPVEVVRDRWGVPHIYAASAHDLFFAQGYVHAQDRLWQMEFNRRVSSGRLGEVLGAGLLDADRYLRTLGLRRAAARDWPLLDQATRAALQAYADGVNQFVATHRGRLPLEFTLLGFSPEPWTPLDSLAWCKLMSLNLGLNHTWEILRARLIARVGEAGAHELLPPYPADAPIIVPPEAGGYAGLGDGGAPATAVPAAVASLLGRPGTIWASNSWAVHGRRTASGRPLLANDTHLGLGMPSVWYENGLHGGGFNVAGFSFAGMPAVVIGFNGRIAWGITNMCADVQDLFLERLDDRRQPRRYLFRGAWRPLAVTHETIRLKGAEPVELAVRATLHGPLVDGVVPELKGGPPAALQWTALAGGRLADALLALDQARGWGEFRQALARWDYPSVNFTYADVDGNVGYQSSGRVPVRAGGARGLVPAPGWTGEHEWEGFIPWPAMPRVLNPPDGFVVTANHRVVGDGYPYYIAEDMADPYRAARIRERLAATPEATPQTARALQADVYSLPAAALRPYLLGVPPGSELERRALAEVAAWDLGMATESAGAAVYQAWLWFLWSHLFADELGEELMASYRQLGLSQVPMLVELLARPESRWYDDRRTPAVEGRAEVLRRSLAAAVAWLAERCGDDPARWTWGRVHPMTFVHAPLGQSGIAPLEWAFNVAAGPVPGDPFTVNETLHDLEQPFAVVFGVSQRLIVDLGAPARSLAVNSTGQSGHAFHRHRADQVGPWRDVAYHPLLTSRAAVERQAEGILTLVPGR
ncbi:MAG TPA: penicillin acylase family protein [Thermoanaerobaculia bacterium]